MSGGFKTQYPLEQRKEICGRLLDRHPDRIPVVVEGPKQTPTHRLLIPKDVPMGQLVAVIRRKVELAPHEALFVFVDNVIPPIGSLVSQIYEEHRDPDGFLYLDWRRENTFG